MFCSLQLELNPTIVYHSMFYLLLSHRSCKTICHNPSAASLCCIWNDSSIRCLHFIDHNIALCWIPGNILQPFPLFSSPYSRSHGTAHDCWFLKLLGSWTLHPNLVVCQHIGYVPPISPNYIMTWSWENDESPVDASGWNGVPHFQFPPQKRNSIFSAGSG